MLNYTNTIKNTILVTLTPEQIESCWLAAEHKAECSKSFANKRGCMPSIQRDAVSFASELAVAQHLQIAPQTGVNKFANGKALPDIEFKSRQMDVKSNEGRHNCMLVSPKQLKDHPTWDFGLVTGNIQNGEYRLIGWIKASDIPLKCSTGNMGHSERPPVWIVPQSALTPFKSHATTA